MAQDRQLNTIRISAILSKLLHCWSNGLTVSLTGVTKFIGLVNILHKNIFFYIQQNLPTTFLLYYSYTFAYSAENDTLKSDIIVEKNIRFANYFSRVEDHFKISETLTKFLKC